MYWKPKIKFNPTKFNHHRDGWYASASKPLYDQFFNEQGIVFYDWLDAHFKTKQEINTPWSGILHNVISYPNEYINKYKNKILPLQTLVKQDFFIKSLKYCKGIFTLSKYTCDYLKSFLDVSLLNLYHPFNTISKKFNIESFDKKIYFLGQWLRKYHSFAELESPYKKIIIKLNDFENDYNEMKLYSNKIHTINFEQYKGNNEYDTILSKSILFMDLYDVSACNVVLDAISRNTPILINKHPANIEYLGEDYPFYFSSLQEASDKMNNLNLLKETHKYLINMDKNKFTTDTFIKTFGQSQIYQNISIRKELL